MLPCGHTQQLLALPYHPIGACATAALAVQNRRPPTEVGEVDISSANEAQNILTVCAWGRWKQDGGYLECDLKRPQPHSRLRGTCTTFRTDLIIYWFRWATAACMSMPQGWEDSSQPPTRKTPSLPRAQRARRGGLRIGDPHLAQLPTAVLPCSSAYCQREGPEFRVRSKPPCPPALPRCAAWPSRPVQQVRRVQTARPLSLDAVKGSAGCRRRPVPSRPARLTFTTAVPHVQLALRSARRCRPAATAAAAADGAPLATPACSRSEPAP